MNYDWVKIKKEILAETRDVFSSIKSINVEEALETLRKVLEFPDNQPKLKLDGLPELLNALERILIQNEMSGDSFTALALPYEAYLKKILYLVKPTFYLANAHNITLGDKFDKNKNLIANGLIRELDLNPNNLSYWLRSLPATKHILDEHLWRVYYLRNDLAHFCSSYNKKEFWTGVQSYLVMYLYAAHKHRQALLAAVEPYFLSNYLQKYIAGYQQWQQLFIHIDGVEKQELLESYVVEVPEEEQHRQGKSINEGEHPPGRSTKELPKHQPLRSGSVMELLKSVSEKQMVIIAEPGMGKSTALQFLAYTDALAIENGSRGVNYPVYIELKEFQSKDSIKERIIRQLGIAEAEAEDLMLNGKITLLLDGLNETAQSLRTEAVNSIRRFMEDYSNVFVIVTCRPNAYERNYFDNIPDRGRMPVFQLQHMDMAQMEEFLQKNCKKESIRNTILQALQNNDKLSRIVETPFLLKMLISVVSRHPKKPIPPTETGIILGFLNGIYEREAERDAGFSPNLLKKLLPVLAHQTRMKYQATVPIHEVEATSILQGKALEWEINSTLQKAEELHILVRTPPENNHYSFAHELYQEALWVEQQTQYDQYPPKEPYLYKPAIELLREPAFAQALRLYAGLLIGEKRKEFIKEVAKQNVYLAARCTTAYWQPEEDVVQMVVERAKILASLFSWEVEMSANGFMALIELNDKEAIIAVLQQETLGQSYYLKKLFEGLKPKQILDFIFFLFENDKVEIAKTAIQQLAFAENLDLVAEKQIKKLIEELWGREMYKEVLVIDSETNIILLNQEQYQKLLSMPNFRIAESYSFHYYINSKILRKYINNCTPPFETIKDWLKRFFLVSEEHNYYNFKGFPLNEYPDNRKEIIEIMGQYANYDFNFDDIMEEYNLDIEEKSLVLEKFIDDAFKGFSFQGSYSYDIDAVLRLIEKYLSERYSLFSADNDEENINLLRIIHPTKRVEWIYKYNLQSLFSIEDCITEAIENIVNRFLFTVGVNDLALVEDAIEKDYVSERYWHSQINRLIEAKQFLIAYKIIEKYDNLKTFIIELKKEATFFIQNWDWNNFADISFRTRKDEKNFKHAYTVMQKLTRDYQKATNNEQYKEVHQLIMEIRINEAIKKIVEHGLYNLVSLGMILEGDLDKKPNEEKIELNPTRNWFKRLSKIEDKPIDKATELKNKRNDDEMQLSELDYDTLTNEEKHRLIYGLMIDGNFEKVVDLFDIFKIKLFFEPEQYLDVEEAREKRLKKFSGLRFSPQNQESKLFEFITVSVKPENQRLHEIIKQFLKKGKFDIAKQLIIFYTIEDIEINRLFVQEAIKSKHYIFTDRWIKLQSLQEHFNPDEIIKAALKNNYIFDAKQLCEDNKRQYQFSISVFIEAALDYSKTKLDYYDYNSKHILMWAREWIGDNIELQEKFCNTLLERALIQEWVPVQRWFKEFERLKNMDVELFIQNAINSGNEFDFVVEIRDKYKLESKYEFDDLFYRNIINSWPTAHPYYNHYIDKYNVENRIIIATAYLKEYCNSDGTMPFKDSIKVEGNVWGNNYADSNSSYNKYQITESEIIEAINYGLRKNHVDLVKIWVELVNCAKTDFPMTSIIQTALETNQTVLAQYWVEKYNLYEQFPQFEPPGEAAEQDAPPPEEA